MISNQILQDTIEGIKAITRIDLCVMDTEGKVLASTIMMGNEYEDANYHRFVHIPNIILNAIREQSLGWEIEDCLMKRIWD